MPSIAECVQALQSSHEKQTRVQATEALDQMLTQPNTAYDTAATLCHQYIQNIDPNTLQQGPEGFVALTFLVDHIKRLGEASLGNGSSAEGVVTSLVGLTCELDQQLERAGVGHCQTSEQVVGFKGAHTCRKLGELLGVVLRTFKGGIATVKGLADRAVSADVPGRTATLIVLHTLLRALAEKALGKKLYIAACDVLGSRVPQLLSGAIEHRRLDWVLFTLKIATRAVPRMPIAGDNGAERNSTVSTLCGYLQQGVSTPQSLLGVPRVVEYIIKTIQLTLGDCDSLGVLDLHEVLHVLLAALASPCSAKTFQRTAAVFGTVIGFEDSSGPCASALRAVFVDKTHAVEILTYLTTRYLPEGENADRYDGSAALETTPNELQRLLSSWSSSPEDHILSVPEGETAPDAIAEQLIVTLTQCTSAATDDESPLFVSAAWSMINNLLNRGDDMGRLLAYRVIGLGHYSISTGQEESYKAFFTSTMLPDCIQSHPRVQRRAIWAVGMWCESADEEMRAQVFGCMLQLLTGGNASPVVILAALKTVEHFMNDGSFDPTSLPSGFGPVILDGLSSIVPHVRQPYTVKDLASLILIVLERVPGAKGTGSVGDGVVALLTPTCRRFLDSSASVGGGGDVDLNEDDEQGQHVSCMMTVIEAIQVALWSASDAVRWSEGTSLLEVAKYLVDPDSAGHLQLEEEGWSLLETMIKSTPISGNPPSAIGPVFEFACDQLERDFESRGTCVQVICGCLIQFAAHNTPANPARVAYLAGFCAREIAHVHEQMIGSTLPGSVGMLIMCLCFANVASPDAQQTCREQLFAAAVGSLMDVDEAIVDSSYYAPMIASVVSSLALHVVPRGQSVPVDFSHRLSLVHDVTCSGWGVSVMMTMAKYAVDNLALPGGADERELLQSLVTSASASLSSMVESGEENPAGVESVLELLGDATNRPESPFAIGLQHVLRQASLLQ